MKYLLLLLFFCSVEAKDKFWVGEWIAKDEWQSEFKIVIKQNGEASSNYADGEVGKWKIQDGNLEIVWQSGRKDYIFKGVMGTQRLHKSKSKSYTSGLKRLSN